MHAIVISWSMFQESSGSLYIPSQESVGSSSNIGKRKEDSNSELHILPLEESEPENDVHETEGTKIDGSLLIVPWSCILLLLSKCQAHGCGEQVLPSNIKVSTKGTGVKIQII